MGDIFNVIFVTPIVNGMLLFYSFFSSKNIPGAFGFSVIALTVLVRLILHPFFKAQIDTQRKMQKMKPALDIAQKKYKNDKVKLQAEQARLYKEAGINPLSGCLFMLLQIPVFIALYQTLNNLFATGNAQQIIDHVNKVAYAPFLHVQALDPIFFGINLALSPAKSPSLFYIIIPVVTALLQFIQAKVSMPTTSKAPAKDDEKKIVEHNNKDKKQPSAGEDFQNAMNMQMKYFMPIMIGVFSYQLPLGLSLYWNIFSLFSIIQYRLVK